MTRVIQVNTGMRIRLMPGQRRFRTVTMRLMAPVNEATPVMIRPRFQKSIPWPGENSTPEFGAYMNQPPLAPPPNSQLELRNRPPARKHQKLNALMRGKATSRAPICRGIR